MIEQCLQRPSDNNNNNNRYCVLSLINGYKRASLVCAARLADTLCPPEAPFGRLGSHWLIIREIASLNMSVLL